MNATNNEMLNTMAKAKLLFFWLFSIIAVSLVGIVAYRSATVKLPLDHKQSRATNDAAFEILLQNAKRNAADAVSKRSAEFSEFINSRKIGAKEFSEDVVSFQGKWAAVKPMLPGTAGDGHKTYLVEKFNQHIFTPDALKNATNRSITGGIRDIELIENELAIALRQEILGRSLSPSELPIVTAEFKNAIDAMVLASKKDVTMAAGSLVTSEVVSQISTQVLIRLGATAGIFGVAAANSWWTLGAAMVIGIAVDAVWDYVTQPAKAIEKEMVLELEKMSLNGSAVIRSELTKVVVARSLLWQKTVKDALQ